MPLKIRIKRPKADPASKSKSSDVMRRAKKKRMKKA